MKLYPFWNVGNCRIYQDFKIQKEKKTNNSVYVHQDREIFEIQVYYEEKFDFLRSRALCL